MGRALVTREQWLELGVVRFGHGGRAALLVEAMARELKSSKSGFYWYFRSMREFEREVVSRWHAAETKAVISAAEAVHTPREKLLELFASAVRLRGSGDFLFYLRRLAAQDRSYAKPLASIEGQRLSHLRQVFRELGMAPAAADVRAEILYNYYLGWYERASSKRLTQRDVARQIRIVSELAGVDLARTA
jgi:AcrR family transcriptional regulator